MYKNWTGTTWNIERIDSVGRVGGSTSIALNNSDKPHISYYDQTNGDLKLANWTDNDWNIETVDAAGDVGGYTSMAIDRDDNPHISYQDISLRDLKYARWTGSSWDIEVVDSVASVGWESSLALDHNDHPHISYFNATGEDLVYATKADFGPPPDPVLSYFPTSLDFGTLPLGAVDSKTFEIWNSGGGKLTYSFSEDMPWVTQITPSNGSSTGENDTITVDIDTSSASGGLHAGFIFIASNGGNGSLNVSVNVIAPPTVNLDIDPDALNLKSKGKWITAYLTTENAGAGDIDPFSLSLNDVIEPAWWDIQGETVLMVKFDRVAVQAMIPISDSVDIKVSGLWKDGEIFEVHDHIRVIDPGS
jgi:hypothetical protein